MTKLPKTLRALREHEGLTRQQLADKANVSVRYIEGLEQGLRVNPSVAVLTRIAKALRVPVAELLK